MSTIVTIDDRDPAVVFSSGWEQGTWGGPNEYMGTTSLAQNKGASATLRFNGSSVSVYGTLSNEGPCCTAPTTSYQVDNGPPTTFAPSFPKSIQYKQQFFNAGNIGPGMHTLVVTSMIDNGLVWLDYFEVLPNPPTQAQDPLTSSTSTSTVAPTVAPTVTPTSQTQTSQNSVGAFTLTSPSPDVPTSVKASQTSLTATANPLPVQTSPPASTTHAEGKTPIGVIVGSAVGGIAFIALVVAIVIFCLKKRHKSAKLTEGITTPFLMAEEPPNNVPHSVTSPSAYSSVASPSAPPSLSPLVDVKHMTAIYGLPPSYSPN